MSTSEQSESTVDEAPASEPSFSRNGDEPAKRRKNKVKFAAQMQRAEAVAYFRALVDGLANGRLEFKQGEETLELAPSDLVSIEVKAAAKGEKQKVSFELEWKGEPETFDISG